MQQQVNSFFMKNEFSVIGILFICVLIVALLVRIIKFGEFPSKIIYSIINELKLCKVAVIWYLGTLFLDGAARYKCFMNVINTVLQPTPYKVESLLLPFVYIDKPKDLQIVLNAVLEKSDVYKFADIAFGNSLISTTVPVWKLHRRSIQPMFNSRNLEEYSHVMNKWSRWLLQVLQTKADTNDVFDLWYYIALKNLNLTSETLMGVDLSTIFTTLEKRRFSWINERLSKHFLDRLVRIWLHPEIISNIVHKLQGIFRLNGEALELMSRTVRGRQRILIEDEKKKPVLLDTLCTLHPSVEAEGISESLKHDVFLFFSASYETSALANCFTLLMLAMNPTIQDKVFQEIVQILGKKDGELITIENVEKMHLLDRCIRESLRLYPPVPLMGRLLTGNIKLSNGEVLTKNTNVIFAPYLIHRRPELYENPLVWNPDNFLAEAVQKRHPYSFIPFSAGPRGCIGAKYGILSMKILLATILRKYHFTTDMTMDDVKHDFDLILRSSNGWNVKLHTRH